MPAAPVAPGITAVHRQRAYVLLVCAVGYSIAYFAPWVHVSVLGIQGSTSGPVGLEFIAFLAAAALAAMFALGIAVPGVRPSPLVVSGLAGGCLAFAAGEFAYLARLTRSTPLPVASLVISRARLDQALPGSLDQA